MSKIILDGTGQAQFNGIDEPREVCDEAGKTLGHFIPESVYRRLLQAWAQSQITDDEISELRMQSGGRSLTDIWKNLGRA